MRGRRQAPTRLWRFLRIGGALSILLSVLVLPWVGFADPVVVDRQVEQFLSNMRIQDVLDRAPPLRRLLGIQRLQTTADLGQLFTSPALQETFALARGGDISGWVLIRGAPRMNNYLRFALILSVLLAAVSGFLSMLALIAGLRFLSKVGTVLCSCGAVLLFLWMLWYLPAIDTFGMRGDFGLALVCLLVGSRTGFGAWLALVGLLAVALGGGVDLLLANYTDTEEHQYHQDDELDYG